MEKTIDVTDIDFKSKFSLENKTIIITGGCGLIGKAFVEASIQFGANVVICDIQKTNPEETARILSERHKKVVLGFSMDVANRNDVQKLLDFVIGEYQNIDGLVNSHQNKTANFFSKFEDYEDHDWDAIIETNLKGTYLTCQTIGGWMAHSGGGCIVNLASTYSVVAPNQNLYKGTTLGSPAAYSASKGGVQALSQYLSTYWAGKNVRVNMITPHGVWNQHEKNFENNFSKLSPLGRMSYNHEVASALIFLLSDASSYVTGHNLLIDGGWTAW